MWRNIEDDGPPAERITSDESLIWHWDSESDSLTLIANGWYENEAVGELFHNTISNVCRPSIGVGEDGTLYCIFRQITVDDVIWGDYCAGEIKLSISSDNGITWSEPVNLTDTHVNEDNGEMDYCNELHPSLAERVDDNLHIFYELVYEFYPDGESILDPPGLMIYQRVPVADLPEVADLEMPREGFQYHNYPIAEESVSEADLPPGKFELLNIYPNPFNSTTTIEYALPFATDITLCLYNLSGQRVETLFDGRSEAGVHSTILNAGGLPSGLYFIKFEGAGEILTRKIMLIK
ncbi:MAG: T9SS type A sorting domain-containing protein [Calditrichaeota bacterium]|nr:T9SS type A sorting domain-containing protein [Calditrichota bacterium]